MQATAGTSSGAAGTSSAGAVLLPGYAAEGSGNSAWEWRVADSGLLIELCKAPSRLDVLVFANAFVTGVLAVATVHSTAGLACRQWVV
jgi:hypothetical protein